MAPIMTRLRATIISINEKPECIQLFNQISIAGDIAVQKGICGLKRYVGYEFGLALWLDSHV